MEVFGIDLLEIKKVVGVLKELDYKLNGNVVITLICLADLDIILNIESSLEEKLLMKNSSKKDQWKPLLILEEEEND